MSAARGQVLSLVEKGWPAAREASLRVPEGWRTLHLVKGWLDRAARRLVAPHPRIRLVSVPRRLFWPAAWALVGLGALRGGERRLHVDNDRAARRLGPWVRWFGWQVVRLPDQATCTSRSTSHFRETHHDSRHMLALVFDTDRPDTTGAYFERACRQLGVPYDHWELRDAARIPPDYAAYLRIDHGDYALDLPERLRPRMFYAIDTHLPRSWASIRALAQRYDLVCCAQQQAARALGPRALWVPLAHDPSLREPPPAGGPWDLAFVGHDGGVPRKVILQALRERYPNSYIGTAPHPQLLEIYGRARIAFNYSIRGEVNMRVFEALGAGSLLVTNALPPEELRALGLAEGTHLIVYRRLEELFPCVDRWLADEPGRAAIARAGAAAARAHTYADRLEQILRAADERLSVRLSSGGDVARFGPRPAVVVT